MPESDRPPLPAVAVILVNWNGWRDVIECLDSLLAQSYSNTHIFVVDNDSGDSSVEHIDTWCRSPRREAGWANLDGVARFTGLEPRAPVACRIVERPSTDLPPPLAGCRLTLIRSGANLGFAGGCNVGIRAAGMEAYDFFWFLNTDAVAHRDALDAMVRRAQAEARIGIVGSTIRYYDRPDTVQALGGARMDPSTIVTRHIGEGLSVDAVPSDPAVIERDLVYVCGASMFVSSRFVRDVGLMQEDYFLFGEELDWAMRGRDRFTWAYAPSSYVFHKSGAASKAVPEFSTRMYYRNRIRLAARFFPEHLPAVRRTLVVELLRHALRGRWMHARVVASALRDAPTIARPGGR
jgi:GT2 family glycosyltransferase